MNLAPRIINQKNANGAVFFWCECECECGLFIQQIASGVCSRSYKLKLGCKKQKPTPVSAQWRYQNTESGVIINLAFLVIDIQKEKIQHHTQPTHNQQTCTKYSRQYQFESGPCTLEMDASGSQQKAKNKDQREHGSVGAAAGYLTCNRTFANYTGGEIISSVMPWAGTFSSLYAPLTPTNVVPRHTSFTSIFVSAPKKCCCTQCQGNAKREVDQTISAQNSNSNIYTT